MGKNKSKKRSRGSLQLVTTCISTALVLILLGLVVFTVFTARNLSAYVKENLTVTMMLADDTTDPEAQQLCDKLQKRPYIGSLQYITKDSVLAEQTAEMGIDPSEFAEQNPFLSSIEFQLKAEYANSDSLKWISEELKQNQKVNEIIYPQDLIDSVNNFLSKVSLVLLILAGLLLFVSFSLINNTVRLGIYERRFSIHTMKLVGASWSFIRWPFIKRSIGLGLLAGVIAIAVLGAGVWVLSSKEPDVMKVITPQVLLFTAVAVLVFGVIITTFCCWLSVNKFLRMKASELYQI
ncbi:MAG: permease-like cell division protein FtsX [Prevotella sp.]|nr:permease-like cell division protein FtsX [Prevotella sp.]